MQLIERLRRTFLGQVGWWFVAMVGALAGCALFLGVLLSTGTVFWFYGIFVSLGVVFLILAWTGQLDRFDKSRRR